MAHPLSKTMEGAGPAQGPRLVASEDILEGARKIQICHGDDLYTLQVTRQGKLLLTK